ncbi:alpha/beta hydrolase [Desulfobacterales bacterium HSG16]|nr:alpha/beta hydrolase [Desulfobacterales bacterium HSG16]
MRQLASELENWLKGYNKLLKDLKANGFKQTPTNAREGLVNLTSTFVTEKPVIKWVQDDLVEGEEFNVSVRIYHPEPESRLPVLLYFHGGGHMAGSIIAYDSICRKMALATNHIVVSVDYRLAPECPYPAGIVDAVTVAKNIWATLGQRKVNYIRQLSIAGDSAGGAISATLSHYTQHDIDVDIRVQILIYPSLDYTMQSESIELNGDGYLLQKEKIEWFFDNYFQHDENRRKVSPLYMEFTGNLPESLVISAEFCPLRDEAFAYIQKLNDAGIRNQHLHFDDMAHAFINMENLLKDQCDRLYRNIARFLNSG